jgi:hypothetical protein
MAINLNDNIFSSSPKLLDAKWGPFPDLATAYASVGKSFRKIGMFAIIAPTGGGAAQLYWYKNDTDNLVPFSGNSSVEVYATFSAFPPTGSANVIYIDKSESKSYYWNGALIPPVYVVTASSVEVYANTTLFPQNGAEGVIYIADDTNTSYIWNPALLNNNGDYEVISGSIADTGNIRFDESIIFSTENFVDIHTDDEYVQFSYTNTAFDNNPSEIDKNYFWLDENGAHIEVIGNDVNGDPYNHEWKFSSTDSTLEFPKGSIISETENTINIKPPTALPGQSLVIRPTSGNMLLSASGNIVAGETLTITLTSSQLTAAGQESFLYTITGSTAEQLGLAGLNGQFAQSNWIDDGGNIGHNEINIPIPALSDATTLTLTITDTDPFNNLAAYIFTNNPITVTGDGIISNEASHVHLVAGDPTTVDLYLGDDEQYVKIEKDGGNIVVGTSLNTKNWTFDTDGKLTVPNRIQYNADYSATYDTRSLVDKEYVDSRTPGFEQNFLLMGG